MIAVGDLVEEVNKSSGSLPVPVFTTHNDGTDYGYFYVEPKSQGIVVDVDFVGNVNGYYRARVVFAGGVGWMNVAFLRVL